jgi:transposase-like protein
MSMSNSNERGSRLPAVPTALPGDEPALAEIARQLVERARSEGIALTGQGGLLPALVANVLQTGVNIEFMDHVGYEPYAVEGRGSGNSRNGSYPKTVITEVGPVEVVMPRDRNSTFDPVTVPKHARRLEGLSEVVISLYAKGMTTGEIQAHLEEIHGTELSRETISKITDQIVGDMLAWQNRPLDRLYAVVLIDAIFIKVRDAQVANRPVYVAIGVNMDGERDVLGMWLGPTGGEGAKQWMTMLTELRNRGVQDALIVCCDGLKGLPDAVRVVWPKATVQTCVVHLIRNSLRYASKADWAAITRGLRKIYQAPSIEAAVVEFDTFAGVWQSKYPAMIDMWQRMWDEFVPFLAFPVELRKIVYTTNAIESMNARLRRGVRQRGHFPNEQAAMKVLYLIAIHRQKNRENMTGRIAGWKQILNTLTVHYGERIEAINQ